MSSVNAGIAPGGGPASAALREVPVDWEALEDAFENNAPEVHSYLHPTTASGVVDGGVLTPRCTCASRRTAPFARGL